MVRVSSLTMGTAGTMVAGGPALASCCWTGSNLGLLFLSSSACSVWENPLGSCSVIKEIQVTSGLRLGKTLRSCSGIREIQVTSGVRLGKPLGQLLCDQGNTGDIRC